MPLTTLTPLPFLPIPGKFDLNTFLPGSSDYEILARVVETYNSAVKQFNEIIKFYSQIDKIEEKLQKQLDDFENKVNTENEAFRADINAKIEQLDKTVQEWIDNNLQVMVSKIVKYVWFEVDENGYFIAWIPNTWDFIDFDTDMNPDSEDYGKLALLWEPEVVQ